MLETRLCLVSAPACSSRPRSAQGTRLSPARGAQEFLPRCGGSWENKQDGIKSCGDITFISSDMVSPPPYPLELVALRRDMKKNFLPALVTQ